MRTQEQLEEVTSVQGLEKPEESQFKLVFQNLLRAASQLSDKYYCNQALELTLQYLSFLPDDSREQIFEHTLTAISKVDGNSEDSYYARSLLNLLQYLPEPLKNRALLEAWEAMSSIHDPDQCVSTLKELLPHLPDPPKQEALKKLLEVADNLSRVDDRASIFSNLVSDLPEPLKQQAAIKALAAVSQVEGYYRSSYLTSLLPNLPEALLAEALAVAQKIDESSYRVSALKELIPYLPEPLKQQAATEALAAVSQIEDYYRSSYWTSLLPNLPEALLAEALAVAQKIDESSYRVSALKELIPYLPEPLKQQAATEALAAVSRIESASSCSSYLISLIPHLSSPLLLADALSVAQKIDEPSSCVSALRELISYLPELLKQQALEKILEVFDSIAIDERIQVLPVLITHLSESLKDEVLENLLKVINDTQEITDRISSLIKIIPHISDSAKEQSLLELSEDISNIDEYYQVFSLPELVEYLSPQLLIKSFSSAVRISDESVRSSAIDELLPHIPSEVLPEAFSMAIELEVAEERVLALLELIPRLLEPFKHQAIEAVLSVIGDIPETSTRASVLRKIISNLSGQDKRIIEAMLAIVSDIFEPNERASVLEKLAYHLSEKDKQQAIESALEAIEQIKEDYSRSSTLVSIIPHTPITLFDKAIFIANSIVDSGYRASALKELALYVLPESLDIVLSSAEEISSVKDRIEVLKVLTPRLPEESLHQVNVRCLNQIQAIEDISDRTKTLAILIPQLKNDLLYEALRIARNIQDPVEAEARLEAIDELARRISTEFADVDDWEARRERARENEYIDQQFTHAPRSRARLLADLFFRFEGEQQEQIFEELLAAIDEIPAEPCKSRTLISLANYLPKLESRKVLEKALIIVRGILKDTWTIALENHLSHLPTSLLKSGIELALTRAENYLFGGGRRWWEPNMIHFSEQEPRYFNICLKEPSTNTDLSSDEPLVFNQSYQLRVNISSVVGGLGEEDIFVGEALRDSRGDKETLPLTVIAESKDFEIEQDNRVQTLNLPRKGSSQAIDFQVKPCISMGSGTIRVYVFYRGYFLQSKEVKALILDTAGSKIPGALTARRLNATQDFINPNELHLLPERMLTINVAADAKDQSVTLTFLNRVNGDEELVCHDTELPSDALVGMISGIRSLLELMIKGGKLDGQDVRGYANILSGDNKMLNNWLPRLAEVGYNLYRLLFDNEGQESEESARALLATLQPDTVIQVNSSKAVLGMTTIPWGLLYQRETSYIPGLTQVCEESINPSTPERRDCSGCPLAEDLDTVCPFAFWGYRYSIEQLPAWISNEASDRIPSLVKTIRNNKPLNLNLIVYPGFKMWDGHRQEIEKIGPEFIQLRLAKEGKITEVITHWNSYGTDLDLIYFYTHGDMDQSGQPYLKLSDVEMIRSNLLKRYEKKWIKKPLVILNGCSTGDYKSDSYVSFITAFRAAGASGVVGSECSVPESFAVPYANQLLSHLFKGKPLGQAMLNVRLQFLKENKNPLGLVYSLYAAHEIALAQALSS
jgi:hypothetical protein